MKKFSLTIIALGGVAIPLGYWVIGLAPAFFGPGFFYDLGRLCALFAFVLLFFQYLLSARVKWIERGIGLDVLFGIHKKFGVLALCLVIAHPSLMFIGERLQGLASPFHLLKGLGLAALLLLLLSAGAALIHERLGLKYETWKGIHKTGYILYPFAFVHSFLMGSTVQRGPVRLMWALLCFLFVLVLFFKALRRWALRRRPFKVTEARKEGPSVCTLFFQGKHRDYQPGQFMILQLKRRGAVSEPHPFTISSSPTSDNLSVTVKGVGDFTSTVSQTSPSDSAYIDMPYGVFSFLNAPAEEVVFIAGGIGITPFMSMLRYMNDKDMRQKVLLLWANKTEDDILFREELAALEENRPSLRIVHVLSRQDSWQGEKGHINREKLSKWVKDFGKPVFFICGPPLMMEAVKSELRNLGVPSRRILMERFALR